MEIIIISCPFSAENEIDLINQMFKEGLQSFHLRKPGYKKGQLEGFLGQIKADYHSRVKIHSSIELLNTYRLGGIHVPAEMTLKKSIMDLKRQKKISMSSSFHTLEELKRSNEQIDYAFLSPVFDSISKNNYKSRFDYDELHGALTLAKTRVIALGGCEAKKLYQVKQLGFSGAAFLGAVWNSDDPLESYNEIKETASGLS
ncbi:MAG: thiamine phosphate synthase [Deltaproteobacteria bacterium]|nr:thiamine phosphate synthase [Deltaproteobacteria bacterium]